MAFYQDPNSEDEKDNAQGMNTQDEQQADATAPVQLSNQSATVTAPGTGSGSTSVPGSGKPASSGSAPGFQNYAKANQGKAQDRLNASIAQNVANQGQAAKTSINQATTAFDKKADQGSLENRQNAVQDVQSTIAAARGINAGGNVAQEQQDRFKQVINAQYQGPESLRQAGLYEPAATKVGAAQTAIDNTKSATGREELLKNYYNQRADYTSGLNKLDSALLNASKQGVQNLQNTAQAQGNLGQQLDKAQIGSGNLAQNRTKEIQGIQDQARKVFTEGKTAEEKQTEARLDAMLVTPVKDANGKVILKADGKPMTQWDQLPESFKDVIRNKEATNKATQDQRLAEYTKNTPMYDQKTINNLVDQKNGVEAQISKMMAQARGSSIKADPGPLNALIAQRDQLNSQISPLMEAKTKYDSGLQQLKDSYNPNQVQFNSAEAAILGLNNNEGFYNLGENAIKQGVAERDRLISKDEQARQAVLSQLAGLDLSNRLDTNLRYDNADRAGTQSIMDSLDLKGTRKNLNAAEKSFRDMAEDRNVTGIGSKKNKTSGKRYYASETANLGDVLDNAGYDMDGKLSKQVGNADILRSIANVSEREGVNDPASFADPYTQNANIGSKVDAAMNDTASLGGTALLRQLGVENPSVLNGAIDSGTFGATNVLRNSGLDIPGVTNFNFGSMFGSGTSSKESKADAQIFAQRDLQKKMQEAVDKAGFQNRANVVNNDQTTSRLAGLQALLASLDKTNS